MLGKQRTVTNSPRRCRIVARAGCVNAVRGSSNFSGVLRRQVRVRPTAGLIAQAPAPVPPNNFAAAVSYLVAARDFLPQLRRDL
jgi:hypothetical protein